MLKKLLLGMLLLSLVSCSDTQETATEVTKSVVKFSKEMLGGVNKGITEGRKEAEGVDGASIVTDIEEIDNNIAIKIITMKSLLNDTKTEIEIGFNNLTDKPIRIANLSNQGTLLLLDADGYSFGLDSSKGYEPDLTIPANAGKKHSFLFNLPAAKAKTLRLWNKDFILSKIEIMKESDEG
jgi:hypothetical protein